MENTANQFDDKEIKKHSMQQPEEIFVANDGRIAWNGMIFKNEHEFKKTVELMNKPFSKKLLSFISKLIKFFSKK
jgi:hypothetical protein